MQTTAGYPQGVVRVGNVTKFTCSQCGCAKQHESTLSTGYGRNSKDEIICFECCGLNDAKELENLAVGEKMILYSTIESGKGLGYRKGKISNWPGSFEIHNIWFNKGWHNIADYQYSATFLYKGKKYQAKQYGNNTQICHIKRLKG